MARVPAAGRVKTRLIPWIGADNAAGLYQAFLADGLRQYAALGVAVRVYVEGCGPDLKLPVPLYGASVHRQQGDTLADRMDAAFRDTQAAGFRKIVIIGTDHPTLPSRYIMSGFDALDDSASVAIGPADDGGFYILGMHPYIPGLITGRSYSHDRVFRETYKDAREKGLQVSVLEAWYDVDTPDDLQRLADDLQHAAGTAPETRRQLVLILQQLPHSVRYGMET